MKSLLRITALLAWSAFLLWACAIFYLSSLTSDDLKVMPSQLMAFDKLVHAIAFSVGGFFLGVALKETTRVRGKWLVVWVIVGIGLFGASDEIHQLSTPGRSGADFYDWVADMVGGSVAAFVYCYAYGQATIRSNSAGSAGKDSAAP